MPLEAHRQSLESLKQRMHRINAKKEVSFTALLRKQFRLLAFFLHISSEGKMVAPFYSQGRSVDDEHMGTNLQRNEDRPASGSAIRSSVQDLQERLRKIER